MKTLYAIAYKQINKKYEVIEKVVESKNSTWSKVMIKHGYTVRYYDSMTLQRVASLLLEDGPMSDGGDPLGRSLIKKLFPEHAETTK